MNMRIIEGGKNLTRQISHFYYIVKGRRDVYRETFLKKSLLICKFGKSCNLQFGLCKFEPTNFGIEFLILNKAMHTARQSERSHKKMKKSKMKKKKTS